MTATPMTDGANLSTRTTSRPLRTIRLAALAAIGIALLMALPLPALAGSNPAVATAADPSGHAAASGPSVWTSVLPLAVQEIQQHPEVSQALAHAPLSQRLDVPSHEGASSPTGVPAAAHPQTLSGNTYLNAPCSTTSALAAVNGSNSTLVAGLSTLYLLYNASGGSFCNTQAISSAILTEGFVEAERSTNGGQSWVPSWLPVNQSWANPASPMNGSVPGFVIPITGLNLPYASPAVAASNDGTTLLATQFVNGCWFSSVPCTNATEQAPAGISVTRSTDGGASWTNTTVLAQLHYLTYLTPSATCQAAGDAPGLYFNDFPYSPSVAINPISDVAVATWEVFNLHLNEASCLSYISGTVQAAVSANGGASWTAPMNLSSNLSFNPRVAIGPAPHDAITVLYQNWLNATEDSTTGAWTVNWAVTQSTNNGTSWSTPVDTATTPNVNLLSRAASSPDSFYITDNPLPLLAPSAPSFAIDSWATSAYAGNEYAVWNDNQTAGSTDQGYSAIAFQAHSAGALGWTGTTILTPLTKATAYFEPSVSVGPDGTVYVTFYGMSESSGDLNMYALYSSNGGSTWSTLSVISTQTSVLGTGLITIGTYNGLAATSAGAFATWMDCRSSSCTNSYNESAMATLVEPVQFSSNATNVNLTVSTNGILGTVALPGGEAWSLGSTHTVSAPGWFPHNQTTVSSFSNFTGIVNSTAYSQTFNYTGGTHLYVNYQYVPGAFIAGFFSPNITQSRLTIDGANVPLHGYNSTAAAFNYSVASGRTYYLNASASNLYQSLLNHAVGVQAGVTTIVNIVLGKTVGWLAGRVSPVNATLLLNGVSVPINATNGVYNVTEQWGSYWLNATGYGVTNFSKLVTVNPSATTSNSITLVGGWIRGTIGASYPGLSVTVDGVPVSTFTGATFNQSTLGGIEQVVATAPGFNTSFQNVSVTPGRTSTIAILLTDLGNLVGTVGPAGAPAVLSVENASHSGSGGEKPIVSGVFNVSLLGEVNWTVTVTATGYKTASEVVFVRPGKVTAPVNIVLVPNTNTTTNCTVTNTCPPTPTNSTSSSGISPLLIGGILVVVVLLAAIAAVVLMRRRGGSSGGSSAPPEGSMGTPEGTEAGSDTYGGSPPSG
jgi:hypothetical protein